MTDFELQSDIKYYKADDCTAYIQSGKGRHGWVSGFRFEGKSITICYPLTKDDEDIFSTKEKAMDAALQNMIRAIKTNNTDGRFINILQCLGDDSVVDKIENELHEEGQLSLFSTY